MTARTADYGLTVNCGDRRHPPTADYRCRCGYDDAAEGRAAVARFTSITVPTHQNRCPLGKKDTSK